MSVLDKAILSVRLALGKTIPALSLVNVDIQEQRMKRGSTNAAQLFCCILGCELAFEL